MKKIRLACSLVLLTSLFLYSKLIFSQSNLFEGKIHFENDPNKPLGNVQISIFNNIYTTSTSSDLTGHFEFPPDSEFGNPVYLLSYKAGYFTRIFDLSTHPSNDFGMKIASYNTEYTIYLYGRVIDKSTKQPISLVSVFADYGEIEPVTGSDGLFKIQIHYISQSRNILLWFEQEKYRPLVLPVSNPTQFNNPNRPLEVELEPSKKTYNFDYIVRRSDTNVPIKDVSVEIDNVYAGDTDDRGRINIFKTYDIVKREINASFYHEYFTDTTLTIQLNLPTIQRTIYLNPPLFRINSFVYYENNLQKLVGVPNTCFDLEGKEIGCTNLNGQITFDFRAIPGENLFIQFPTNERYLPQDTIIALTKGLTDLNIKVSRETVQLEITAVNEKTGQIAVKIDSMRLVQNNFIIETDKINNTFIAHTNIFNSDEDVKAILYSKAYENIGNTVEIKKISPRKYSGLLSVNPVRRIGEGSSIGTLILNSDPSEARIIVDDELGKLTPDTLKLSDGIHTIWLKKADYVSSPIVVDIEPNTTISENIELEGPIIPIQKLSNWKIALEINVLNFFMKFPSGSHAVFPSPRVGGHFYQLFNSDCGFKISYLASKVPNYFTNQEFNLDLFLGTNRFHWFLGFRESNFESYKRIKARFAGSSYGTYCSLNLGKEDKSKQSLIFLNYYSHSIGIGYERAFSSINKSVPGEFEEEQEFYIGYKRRFKRGMFDFRFGILNPELTVIDIEEAVDKKIDLSISRLFVSYQYFLN